MYKNNSKTVHDDFVEGDTVSEGDTSDEEDIDGSKVKNTRRTGLELPSGSADDTTHRRSKKRKLYVALAIVAVFATSAAVGGGFLFSRNESTPQATPAIREQQPSKSPSVSTNLETTTNVTPSDEETENDLIPDSDANLGLLFDQMLESTEKVASSEEATNTKVKTESDSEKVNIEDKKDRESQPTEWPHLVGLTGIEAKKQLELLCGEETYDIYILLETDPTTRDYRFDRIRIVTNDEGIVTQVPHIG